MAADVYPWRDNRPLKQVLATSRPWLKKKQIIASGGGYSDAEIARAEQRIGRPLPLEISEFYRAVRPLEIFSDDGPAGFGFYQIQQPELCWKMLGHDDAVPVEDWANAQGLSFGQSLYGDPIFWVKGHRTQPDGCIMIFDHEQAIGDVYFAILARSLSEFLGKIVFLNGLDGGDPLEDLEDDQILNSEDDELLAILNQDGDKYELFRKEYRELNPTTQRHRA